MKKIILALLLLSSLSASADNPEDQYCGKEQYGYLYRGELYTLPFGLGWRFPKPPTGSSWEQKSPINHVGAGVYQLNCPLDGYVIVSGIVLGMVGFQRIRKMRIQRY